MNSPDEIKKGLEYLSITNVAQKVEAAKKGLPYAYTEEVAADALALIQQLQAENAEKDERIQQLEKRAIHLEALNQSNLTTITMQERTRARFQERISQLESDKQQLEGMLAHMNQLRDAAAGRALKMEDRVRQLEAERDAMKEALGLMVYQYCVRGDKLDHLYMCAGETAFRVLGLEQYGDTRTLESWLFPECQDKEE